MRASKALFLRVFSFLLASVVVLSGVVPAFAVGNGISDVSGKLSGGSVPSGFASASGVSRTAKSDSVTGIVLDGESSTNVSRHNYTNNNRWSSVVRSYLVERDDGSLERVEYTGSGVISEIFSTDGTLLSSKTIPKPEDLSLFGGFFAGEENYYLVYGQQNEEESNSCEILRVTAYSKTWQELASESVYGANTYIPFDAGSLRMTETAGYLYVYTCHEMYASSDGLHHQANMIFVFDQSDLHLVDGYSGVMNIAQAGYVSHSFNQYIDTDGTYVFRVDHGDAYPRNISLVRSDVGGSITDVRYTLTFSIQGSTGANDTGVAVGGLALSSDSVLIAANSVSQGSAQAYDPFSCRNVFLSVTDKDLFHTSVVWLTDYSDEDGITVGNPHLVKINDDRFLVLWEENLTGQDKYVASAVVDGRGTILAQNQTENIRLSDCAPILCADGNVRWYVTDYSAPVLYTMSADGELALPDADTQTPEEPTDPEPTDPEPTDPAPTDPDTTDPEPTDPEPSTEYLPLIDDDFDHLVSFLASLYTVFPDGLEDFVYDSSSENAFESFARYLMPAVLTCDDFVSQLDTSILTDHLDPMYRYDICRKIPAEPVDELLYHMFGVVMDKNVLTKLWYYSNGYYYVSLEGQANPVALSFMLEQQDENDNGTYQIRFLTEEYDSNFEQVLPGSVLFELTGGICSVEGERIWKIDYFSADVREETPSTTEEPEEPSDEPTTGENTTQPSEEPSEPVSPSTGDVNGDGKITSTDARLALRAAVGLEDLSEAVRRIADANGDGKLNSSDARLILRVAVGLESLL